MGGLGLGFRVRGFKVSGVWGIGASGVLIEAWREFQFDWRCSRDFDVWDVGFRRVPQPSLNPKP